MKIKKYKEIPWDMGRENISVSFSCTRNSSIPVTSCPSLCTRPSAISRRGKTPVSTLVRSSITHATRSGRDDFAWLDDRIWVDVIATRDVSDDAITRPHNHPRLRKLGSRSPVAGPPSGQGGDPRRGKKRVMTASTHNNSRERSCALASTLLVPYLTREI